ncbi:MAG: N-acyl-D-amino-acid deacylase family protein [Woeseiaceae bacterium]
MIEVTTIRIGLLTSVLICLAACAPEANMEEERFDVLIINGQVYDGTLEPGRLTNLAIIDERIVSVDAPVDAPADLIIDANNQIVVPGFIDPHTHVLDDILSPERHSVASHLTQAVTTVFVGNDGGGLPDRSTMVQTMQAQGVGTNVGYFAGHNQIRESVMGLEDRPPTPGELANMQDLVAAEMQAGALGLSTGLFYKPGSYATTEEVIELAKTAARFGGIYDSHIRDESSYNIGLVGSVREVIRIGREADIPAHIAHIKALGRDVWGQSGDLIALIDSAREAGLRVTADQYPWQASGTRFGAALIPRWAMADSNEAMFARLANPDLQDQIREEIESNIARRGGADSMLVTGVSEWRGMTLDEIAERLEIEPVDAAIEVVRGGDPSIASFNMKIDDIGALAIQPWVMTGSDGGEGHPRKYASYPKAYREFVVDQSILTIEQWVHRSSGLVADTFALCDRGYLRQGRKADIAIIDLATYEPQADFENPSRLATGVTNVLVNGKLAIGERELQQVMSGQVIDRQNLNCEQ